MKTHVNWNGIIWTCLLGMYASLFSYLLISGKISLYLHPKMNGYIAFMVAILSGIILVNIRNNSWKSKRKNKIKVGNLIFALPIVMFVVANPSQLDASMLNNKGYQVETTSKVTTQTVQPETNSSNPNTKEAQVFLEQMNKLANEGDQMMGQTVELTGMIYLQDDFTDQQFVLCRLMINCCAADGQVIGILCETDSPFTFASDQWVCVSGVVEATTYLDPTTQVEMEMTQIHVTDIKEVESPEEPYVYPY